jgi:hypothetical protein
MNLPKTHLSLRLVLPILALYFVISATGLYYHELFLDEAQHFLLGRDSDSLSSLYYNTRYDGHPRLWDALLFSITHWISPSYAGMQVVHLMITTAVVFVFLRFAPFGLPTKLLILCGYYFLFEYNLLSRNYSLGILQLFSVCCLLRNPDKNLLWIGVLILLMCNTHMFYTFAGMGIFLYLFARAYEERKLAEPRFILFSLFCVTGLTLALIQFQTPGDDNMIAYRPADWISGRNLSYAVNGLIHGWLPLPQVKEGHIWNSYWLSESRLGGVLWSGLFIALLLFPALALRGDRRPMLFYYSSLLPFLLFLVVTRFVASRYYGMVFIYFLAACWMRDDKKKVPDAGLMLSGESPGLSGKGRPLAGRVLRAAFFSILVLQALIGVYFFTEDLRRPFSQSRHAAAYLQEKGLANGPIAVDGCIAGPMLCAYLERKLYYMDIDQQGSFCVWKKSNFPTPRRTIEDEFVRSSVVASWKDFILVSNRHIDSLRIQEKDQANFFELQPMASFQNGIIGWESYYIYRVTCQRK